MPTSRILLVDDEPLVLDSLGQLLEAEGFEVIHASTCEAAIAALSREGELDAVLTDLRLPDGDAIGLLGRLSDLRPNVPAVVFSGVGTLQNAVDAMKAGALDFLAKPVDPAALLAVVRRAIEHRGLVEEVRRLRAAVGPESDLPRLVGSSRALAAAIAMARRAAASDVRVLLRGESGTGKELLAHEIHRWSRRAKRPFVRLNCAAVAESLFESEMFGHRRGAFTGATEDRVGVFAEAHEGTLALDEVGTLPMDAQAKLLRVLETGEYAPVGDPRRRRADVRVIAITNEDLAQRVKAGTFREDLYFRLNVVPIVVPPLRERKEDIRELATAFLDQIARREGGGRKRLDEGALEALARHDWPGNVRELRNVLEHACVLTDGTVVRAALLDGILGASLWSDASVAEAVSVAPATPAPTGEAASGLRFGDDLTLRTQTEQFQRELLREALRRSSGRKTECARLLGVDPRNLAYYLRKHGLFDGTEA